MSDFALYLQAVGDYIYRLWNSVITQNWFLLLVVIISLVGVVLEVIHIIGRKK